MLVSNRGPRRVPTSEHVDSALPSPGSERGLARTAPWALSLVLAAVACGDDDPPSDAGATDLGRSDAGMDMGTADGGSPDSGPGDVGEMDGGTPEPLEIIGVYASQFGQEEVITEERFNSAAIRAYDNAANVLITQNSTTSEFNPGLFNRIEWTDITGDTFYYCFVDFGLETLEAAESSSMTADPSDPDNGGCGMFSWTRLRRAVSIRGRYMSNFGGMETITATSWQNFGPPMRLVDWSEMDNWVVTQNSPDAMFFPDLYGRIEFTEPDAMSGTFYYCTIDFGLMTAEEARTSTLTADASDPETSGCGSFPWTRLEPL